MDSIKVSDCMSRHFVSFTADMSVIDAAILLVQNELLGGPVLDSEGHLMGWISEQDCLGVVNQVAYYAERVASVSDIMRTDLVTAHESDSFVDLAAKMAAHKPKNYPVVDDTNRVLGVISRRHILRKMCDLVSNPEPEERAHA